MNDTTAPKVEQTPFEPLLVSLMTTADAERISVAIDNLLAQLYQHDRKDIQKKIEDSFDNETGKYINTIINEQKIDKTNQEEIRKLFLLLKETINQCEILSLTLSLYPNGKTISILSSFAKEHFGQRVILEINVNPAIIAGAVIVFQGRYIDQSFKKKLDILFEVKKEEIASYIK